MSSTAFGVSLTLEVVHWQEKLAPESGVEFMTPILGACVSGLRPVLNPTQSEYRWCGICGHVTAPAAVAGTIKQTKRAIYSA